MINRPKISDGGKYTCKTEIQGEQQEVSAEISFVGWFLFDLRERQKVKHETFWNI